MDLRGSGNPRILFLPQNHTWIEKCPGYDGNVGCSQELTSWKSTPILQSAPWIWEKPCCFCPKNSWVKEAQQSHLGKGLEGSVSNDVLKSGCSEKGITLFKKSQGYFTQMPTNVWKLHTCPWIRALNTEWCLRIVSFMHLFPASANLLICPKLGPPLTALSPEDGEFRVGEL